jgi:hypothetical protein
MYTIEPVNIFTITYNFKHYINIKGYPAFLVSVSYICSHTPQSKNAYLFLQVLYSTLRIGLQDSDFLPSL